MVQGRSIRLFLVDGVPTGLRTAEIMNWTGHVLVAPRSQLPEALKRPEVVRTGIYFLTGDDPAQPGRDRVYIGEGDNVIDRLKSHAKDETKEFWTHATIVTSKDTNLTKSHARYLESRIIGLAKTADRANVSNGNDPSPKLLPESDAADMEFFITQLQVILPVLGLQFLRPRASLARPQLSEVTPAANMLQLIMQNKKRAVSAEAVEDGGEVTVLAGSLATAKEDSTSYAYAGVRKGLIESGVLKPAASDTQYEFTEDVPFRSPSEAAAVILNRSSNGRTEWKVKSTGQTLKDWQDSQL